MTGTRRKEEGRDEKKRKAIEEQLKQLDDTKKRQPVTPGATEEGIQRLALHAARVFPSLKRKFAHLGL